MADLAASDADNLQARLDALHASGADRHDPIRFAYLAALARRAVSQPEAIRQPLIAKITALADELAARQAAPPAEIAEEADDKSSPLANLLAYIGRQVHQQTEAGTSPPQDRHPTRAGAQIRCLLSQYLVQAQHRAATHPNPRPGPGKRRPDELPAPRAALPASHARHLAGLPARVYVLH